MPVNRTAVVPNGIDPLRLVVGNRQNLRVGLGIQKHDVVLAIIGSLIRRKGHDVLIEALGQIGDIEPAIHLLVVGDGPERTKLKSMKSNLRVHFLGECADVGAILRDAVDILVVPSRQEAFGLVISEAGFFGIPAIGTDVGGIPEIVRAGETGLLTPPEDAAGLADAIVRLATNVELRRRMGEAARLHVKSHFLVFDAVRNIERNYEHLIFRRRSELSDVWNSARPYWRLVRCLAAETVRKVIT
jgi:hypothetical protein